MKLWTDFAEDAAKVATYVTGAAAGCHGLDYPDRVESVVFEYPETGGRQEEP